MTNQALSAWSRFIRGHAWLTRELNAELQAEHGLTLNDYEVLLLLSHAEERAMRRIDLANAVVLTASGITRLLDGLERAGWVRKSTCDRDARVSYAVLTDAGYGKLREAGATHVEGIRRLFGDNYTDDELEALARLLSRIGGDGHGEDCTAG